MAYLGLSQVGPILLLVQWPPGLQNQSGTSIFFNNKTYFSILYFHFLIPKQFSIIIMLFIIKPSSYTRTHK